MSDTSNMSFTTDTSDISDTELVYDAVSVSKALGVRESTLRKYCALMQKYNYQFSKNTVGHRVFFQKDVDVLRKIVELKNGSAFTLEEAVKTVLSESDITDMSSISDTSDTSDISDYSRLLEEFSAFRREQERFNLELLQQLQLQQDYIKNSIEERDKKLMLALRESQEARREIASANQKKWWKFWK
jgi:DNA-binding transcriptional MerR regulator